MTHCPTCGKDVDPLRAPAVSVRDGKVVPYCSKECRSAAESQPVAMQPTKTMRVPSNSEASATLGKPRTPSSGVVAAKSRDFDSGPVIEIVHEPSSGVVTSASDARSGRARSSPRAETDGAIQIADTGHLDDYVAFDDARRGKGLFIALVLVAAIVGGGAGAYYLGYFDRFLNRETAAAVPDSPPPPPPPVEIDAAPALTAAIALERAQQALRTQLKSQSARVQRVAASALARTGDQEALELLATALGKETGEIAKLDIAYALARGRDKRGSDGLMAIATGPKRDPKLEAGRRLALLGDKRAVSVLENYLAVSQLQLGIAEQLAYLGEPRALKILETVRVDAKAVPDEQARATIALGHAGRADVAPALRELLADDRNNSFAAVALAGLHDEAARPVLVKQLSIPSLRVQAARALRRLAPETDVLPLLPPLLAALETLDSSKDTEQVQIAEAILLLAGPAEWSERE